ncbi:Mobile element protein [Richelia intracellularis]|nr:Mobile element protein [Richelia intracellularis]
MKSSPDSATPIMNVFRWIVEVVLRPLEKKGFTLLPKPWVVERTFG